MGYNILICDDDTIYCELIEAQLESFENYTFRSVNSSEAAIKALEEDEYDLILMDIFLKGSKDGITTVSEINQYHDIPVVYITGSNPGPVFERAKSTLPNGYLLKPLNSNTLKTTIETALQRFRMEQNSIESNRMFQRILDASSDAKRYIDTHFLIIQVNSAFETFANMNRQNIIGRYCWEIPCLNDCEGTGCLAKQIYAGKIEKSEYVKKIEDEQGRLCTIIITGTVIQDPKGTITGMVESYRDITGLLGEIGK